MDAPTISTGSFLFGIMMTVGLQVLSISVYRLLVD